MSPTSFKQRSPEWFLQRSGKFTASNIWKLFDTPDVAEAYIEQVVKERILFEAAPEKGSFATRWGQKYEPIAKKLFENAWGVKVKEVGFIDSVDPELAGWVGASPDGIIEGYDAGIEIKCPNKKLFLQTRDYGQIIWKHRYQITCLALVTGLTQWFYISYNPSVEGQRIFVRTLSWSELPIEVVHTRLVEVVKKAKELEEKLKWK